MCTLSHPETKLKCWGGEDLPAGSYQVFWDTSAVPSGIYFYRVQAGNYSETKKMVLLR
ncbi:MAG: T9SS type A sorting domain-containing protein [candidate division Zixibacteria bacterium]|nr:T9SS type A sorting domain-containing protein [candidate division Zixibacteria bacterium]